MEIKPHYSAPQWRRHTGNCCVEVVDMVPMRPKDVYLQNGCWHALWEGAVDHSEAPFHGCMELLLASLQGQGDPSCSAQAPSELSFLGDSGFTQAWMMLKGSDKLRTANMAALCAKEHRETRQVGELNRRGSFLPQRPLLWQKPLAKKKRSKIIQDLGVWGQIKKEEPLRVSFRSHHIRINPGYICLKTFFQAALTLYRESTCLTETRH